MTTTSHDNDARVLVSLTPEDIWMIRQGLRMLLQIHTRKEGYGAIRQALAALPDEESLAVPASATRACSGKADSVGKII